MIKKNVIETPISNRNNQSYILNFNITLGETSNCPKNVIPTEIECDSTTKLYEIFDEIKDLLVNETDFIPNGVKVSTDNFIGEINEISSKTIGEIAGYIKECYKSKTKMNVQKLVLFLEFRGEFIKAREAENKIVYLEEKIDFLGKENRKLRNELKDNQKKIEEEKKEKDIIEKKLKKAMLELEDLKSLFSKYVESREKENRTLQMKRQLEIEKKKLEFLEYKKKVINEITNLNNGMKNLTKKFAIKKKKYFQLKEKYYKLRNAVYPVIY